nr:inosine-5'-monophosphate dehydrogenase [uncultured archaeon]
MKVSEVMGKPVIISPDATVKDAAKKMSELNITTLMVIDINKLVGILTEGDISRRFATSDRLSKDVCVKDIMSSHLIKVEADENVEYACSLMAKNEIRRLPVVSKGRLVGIITSDYIAKHLPEIGVDSFF